MDQGLSYTQNLQKRILEEMKTGVFSESKRLPRETVLAQQSYCIQIPGKILSVEAYKDLTEIHPAAADEELSKLLDVPVGTLLLNMEEVDYDIEGNPVFYSRQYFVDTLIKHTVLRKKI